MGYRNPLLQPFSVSGGTIDTVTTVTGNVVGSTGSVAGNVAGSVASVTGNVGGSVIGSVASVTGNVGGNVIGSVANVTGAVGSVTGAVGSVAGNVAGSVASVVGAVGSVAGNVVGSVASVVGAVGSVTGSVGSVTGDVGGNVAGTVSSVTGNVSGSVVGSVASVTGSVASVTGNVAGSVVGSVASVVGNVTGNVIGSVTNVTTYVPMLIRDTYFWPGISGETLPPTRHASVTYSSRLSKACYKITGTAPGSTVILTTPNISRSPYDTTKKTVSWQWKHLAHAALATSAITPSALPIFMYATIYSAGSSPAAPNVVTAAQAGVGWGIYHNVGSGKDNKLHAFVSDGTTLVDAALILGTAYTVDTWHTWQVDMSDTQTKVTLDGVLLATLAAAWPNNSTLDPTVDAFVWAGDLRSNSGQSVDALTELQCTYSA